MDVGFKTDKGTKRMNNEDAFFVMKNDGIYILADGVGGTNSGEIASRTAVNEIAQYFEDNPVSNVPKEDICAEMFKAIKKANTRVYNLSRRYEENRGMATTMVIAIIREKDLYLCNVGDSRAYLYDSGILTQLSEDHTYVNALVKAGVITADEAATHSDKNMITKAVGAEAEIAPDFFHVSLVDEGCLLLCTDGLYGEVSDEEIIGVFEEGSDMTDTCDKLVDMANANGGNDNITVICIKLMEDEIR